MTDRGLKIRETFRKKYGVDHPSQLLSVKEKIKQKRLNGAYDNVVKKMKSTLKEKYGTDKYVNVNKVKETKKQKYGNPNYNNREKMKQTIMDRYNSKVSPKTLESAINRSRSGEFGFKSSKYKKYLDDMGVTNISQVEKIRIKRKNQKIAESLDKIFNGNRLKGIATPLFEKNDYKGSDYINKYPFRCSKCNYIFSDVLYSGNIPRCLKCYPHVRFHSKIEDEINDFIKSFGILTERNNRSILSGNEIDILLPELKIGIECNGIIWHSESFGKKDRFYHLNKTITSEKNNIKLIHITDWEWINKTELIKSIITSMLGKLDKIYARKCYIRLLSEKEKSNFLNDNHIQGNDKSSVKIGLFRLTELVSVMTFCKSRFDKIYEYEMSRFCSKRGVSVIGGASKMFSYFIKNYHPKSIVSYCDRRFFTGGVYLSCGMKKVKDSPPGYSYFHKNYCVPINRIKFQKHKLKKILKVYDPTLSEWENMQLNGYDRIWDCGNYKFEWKENI